MPIQIFRNGLALNEDDRLTISDDCIVNLFTLLYPNIYGKLRDEHLRIEHVIAEHGEKRHNDRSLRSLFGLNGVLHALDTL